MSRLPILLVRSAIHATSGLSLREKIEVLDFRQKKLAEMADKISAIKSVRRYSEVSLERDGA